MLPRTLSPKLAVLSVTIAALASLSLAQPCPKGTAERAVHRVQLDGGGVFCLRLPRLLKKPEKAAAGTASWARTFNDTCGLYAITLHKALPAGGGPPPHIHHSQTEFFLPTTPGDTVRMFSEAQQQGKATLRKYQPGEVPGYNLPPVAPVGHLDVPYGRIAYSPPNIPHSWKAVNNMTNFMAFWIDGFNMIPSVDIPAVAAAKGASPTQVLFETAVWGSPTDITSTMFGGPQYVAEAVAKKRRAALPAATAELLKGLQERFDKGEACYPADDMPVKKAAP